VELFILSSPWIWCLSVQVYHHHLCPGMSLDPVDHVFYLRDHLVWAFPGWLELRWLPSGPGWSMSCLLPGAATPHARVQTQSSSTVSCVALLGLWSSRRCWSLGHLPLLILVTDCVHLRPLAELVHGNQKILVSSRALWEGSVMSMVILLNGAPTLYWYIKPWLLVQGQWLVGHYLSMSLLECNQ
jgi:hypothetical protein